jgi:hypothetical protein
MNWRLASRVHLANERIAQRDAERQMRTAQAILKRFDKQPGVILADEVGMGKTFVALAVAVSVVEATGGLRPVVVMVPNAVKDKWPIEWEVFRNKCLSDGPAIRAPDATIEKGSDFLKLLDDPPDRRHQLIFLTHGALTSSLTDRLVRMAIVRKALMRSSLRAQRRAFPRFAPRVMRGGHSWWPEDFVTDLLAVSPAHWRRVYNRHWTPPLDDEPIPEALIDALTQVDLKPLIGALRELPLRESTHIEVRLRHVRQRVDEALVEVWGACLRRLNLELPLLMLDEAHHTKNPGTRLASLFADAEARQDVELLAGPLNGVFDRMLFLTATPFQLAHSELIEVLRRFAAVRWADRMQRNAYEGQVGRLHEALDDAQVAAQRLDEAWGRLTFDEVTEVPGQWWRDPENPSLSDPLQRAAERFAAAAERNRSAERLLKQVVIRHARPDREKRREVLCGAAVLDGSSDRLRGLEVTGRALLPFLLAARTQAVVAAQARREGRQARAHFAEGIASSFQAYRKTREEGSGALDVDATHSDGAELSSEADWYLREVDRALPASDEEVWGAHPKIGATVRRAVELWKAGEKVLVFCFYVETGRALRHHISRAIADELLVQGAAKLGHDEGDRDAVINEVRLLGERFFDPKAPVTQHAHRAVRAVLGRRGLDSGTRDRAVEVALRFLRTTSFLVRHVDLEKGRRRGAAVTAFDEALDTPDASGLTLRDKLRAFGTFLGKRQEREREAILEALESIQTGSVFAEEHEFDESEGARGTGDTIPNVRLANGRVREETRRRLLRTFNTPFFPEVLVASSVMAEGVDLHLNCRHVIHHDLDWNPSVLEQRTGRLDRLGSLAERARKQIVVYEPFVEGTQDEKLFRVVKDRERWFNVVMGERLELDEWSTEKLANRVPLPHRAAEELALDLSVR